MHSAELFPGNNKFLQYERQLKAAFLLVGKVLGEENLYLAF